MAEAWRKRRYKAAFIAKLNDCEAEAAETQVWLKYATECGYMDRETASSHTQKYDEVIGTLVGMINHSDSWIISK